MVPFSSALVGNFHSALDNSVGDVFPERSLCHASDGSVALQARRIDCWGVSQSHYCQATIPNSRSIKRFCPTTAAFGNQRNLAFSDDVHCFVSRYCAQCSLHGSETLTRRDPLLHETVVLLNDVVQVRRWSAAAFPAQFPGLLQLGDRRCICRVTINIDDARSDRNGAQGQLQKALCRRQIPVNFQSALRTDFHPGYQQSAVCRMDRGAGIGTVDRRTPGSTDSPCSHSRDEWG